MRTLLRRADTRAFPLVVTAVAVAATLSMSVPFAGLLVAAVLMAPRRWVATSLWSCPGSVAAPRQFFHPPCTRCERPHMTTSNIPRSGPRERSVIRKPDHIEAAVRGEAATEASPAVGR
jgi:hypothetical protein